MGFLCQAFESIWQQAGDGVFFEDGSEGAAKALNRAVQRAKEAGHSYFLFHAADDIAAYGMLDRLADELVRHPDADVVYPMIQAMDADGALGHLWGQGFVPSRIYDTPMLPGAALISVECWERAGGFPDLLVGADWGMYAKAHKVRPLKAVFCPDARYYHRAHPETETAHADKDRSRYEALYAFLRQVEAS